jgi:hypothetical protein
VPGRNHARHAQIEPRELSMSGSRREAFALAFVRYWGANMQTFVWSMDYEWPGFTYPPEDRALLTRWGATVGSSLTVFVAASVVLFLILASAILAVVWGPVLTADPATTSAITFFVTLGAACVLSISVGFPLAVIGAATIAGRFAPPFEPPAEDVPEALRVYRTVIGQIRRVGLIGGVLVPIGSLLMLVSATFERVVVTLGSTLPWVIVGIAVVESLLRFVPAPDRRESSR